MEKATFFIQMKMFQPLITEATGKKKINSHFTEKHLSLHSRQLVRFDSKFNMKSDESEQGGTFYKVQQQPTVKEGRVRNNAWCLWWEAGAEGGGQVIEHSHCFIDHVRGQRGIRAPQASGDSRKYSVKGNRVSILVEDLCLCSLTFKLESVQAGTTINISTYSLCFRKTWISYFIC